MNKQIKRIMIIGRPGGGKSTFALQLQTLFEYPLHHLDKHFYIDHWEPRNYQEFLGIQQTLVDNPTWIIDGNSTKSYEMRYEKVELCLYFNFPRMLCYWRVFKRLFNKRQDIDDRAPHCYETVRWSLLTYMWNFEKRVRPILSRLRNKYPDVVFIEVCKQRDLISLIEKLRSVHTKQVNSQNKFIKTNDN